MIEPGIYTDMLSSIYHDDKDSYSKSSLVDFAKYPYYLWYKKNQAEEERKNHFDLGTAIHTAILEPNTIDDVIAAIPNELLGKNGAKSTKACKQWIASQPKDKAVVTMKERDMIMRIRDNVLDNPRHSQAKELLTGGKAEVSFFWEEKFLGEEEEEETGYRKMILDSYSPDEPEQHKIMLKCRPDYIPGDRTATDLKTSAQPIDLDSFERTAYNLHYHWSAGLTLRGMTQVTNKQHNHYYFVVVETNPPHEVAVYRASHDLIRAGQVEILRQLERLAWCDKHDTWPGIPDKVTTLGLPGWAYKKVGEAA